MAGAKAVIRAEDVRVERSSPGRGPVEALRGVRLTVGAGELAVVLGRSGAGKTTLLEALAGLLPLSGGTVSVGGSGPKGGNEGGRPGSPGAGGGRRGVGLLFQHPERQLFGATALEDVSWGLGPGGAAAAALALERVEVRGDLWEVPLSRLSRGERRRVALAGVLVRRPRVLLLDEPAVGLDPAGQSLLLAEIEAYRAETSAAVVVATHWPEPLLERADIAACLENGAFLYSGPVWGLRAAAVEEPAVGALLPFGWRLRAALERETPWWGEPVRRWFSESGLGARRAEDPPPVRGGMR